LSVDIVNREPVFSSIPGPVYTGEFVPSGTTV
jgi:hypothetical protein